MHAKYRNEARKKKAYKNRFLKAMSSANTKLNESHVNFRENSLCSSKPFLFSIFFHNRKQDLVHILYVLWKGRWTPTIALNNQLKCVMKHSSEPQFTCKLQLIENTKKKRNPIYCWENAKIDWNVFEWVNEWLRDLRRVEVSKWNWKKQNKINRCDANKHFSVSIFANQ